MPGKSRHSRRKKSFKASKRVLPVAQAPAQQKPTAGEQPKPAVASIATSRTTKSAPAAVMQYPFIKKELISTGILSVIIFIIIVVLYFVL